MDIVKILIQRNIIDRATALLIEAEAKKNQVPVDDLLLAKKAIDEEMLFSVKSEVLGIPLRYPNAKDIPLKVLELIPEDSAQHYSMIPVAQKGGVVEVGMIHPEDSLAQEALKFLSRRGAFSWKEVLVTPSVFEAILRSYRNQKEESSGALKDLQEALDEKQEAGKKSEAKFQRLVEEAPVTKMVAVVLRNAVEGKASDIHIEPGKEQSRVRFRFLGELFSSLFLPKSVHNAVVARIKILSQLKIDETRIPQDGRFSMVIDERGVDFRVSTFPTALGEKVAIRVLDPDIGMKSLQDLGLRGDSLQKVERAAGKPFGLVLVTGPTGSGKSTTLYAMLQSVRRDSLNVVSLEDPVEYLMDGVNQSQMKPEIGYDFAQGLRQILRQDPDIIMVGEVRDKETATLVVHAALTGHVVLSTLHTNNAIGAIPRLLDMGVDKYLIAPTISAALSQRLVRRLCDNCKEKVEPQKGIKELILQELQRMPQKRSGPELEYAATGGKDLAIFEPKGCRECSSIGYTGRIGIFEVLEMTDELAGIVIGAPSEAEIEKEAVRQGMMTMRQDGILKVLDGMTSMAEVIRVTEE
ncbi:MAG: type II/IV secretion system protein [Candidatus Wildermuthbacteria bacterium]|nr:type II/IV secretion system protein [Candidatus Wildermuthbacteria bacterium]